MKVRSLVAGLILAVAIAPSAVAAPKTAAPQPVGGTVTVTEDTNFFCPIFPWLAMCHPR